MIKKITQLYGLMQRFVDLLMIIKINNRARSAYHEVKIVKLLYLGT